MAVSKCFTAKVRPAPLPDRDIPRQWTRKPRNCGTSTFTRRKLKDCALPKEEQHGVWATVSLRPDGMIRFQTVLRHMAIAFPPSLLASQAGKIYPVALYITNPAC